MSGPVTRHHGAGKKSDCRIRQSKPRIRQSISPVMQKVKSLLPSAKAAATLHILTDQPFSTCEKMLCGARPENVELLTALLRSDLGRDVLFALMGDARPEWFSRYRKQLDVNAARRQLLESQKLIEKLQQEAADEA
ncbi:hypothetical protein [Rhodopseudomonas sp. RCAM05734]|uniref:hypothetical protein n=1 Tax=Rhodopseudomonas sp. RCAM05734 TaxID=3457549 RepID=UPI004043F373